MATSKRSDGDGLRRDGVGGGKLRYLARITARHPDTGAKWIDTDRVIFADTKADALKQRDAIRDEMVARKLGRLGSARRIRVCDALDGYMATVTRYGTARSYWVYARAIKSRFGDRWLDALEVDEVQRWIATDVRKRYASKSALGGHRSVLVNTYDWAVREGLIKAPHTMRAIVIDYRRTAAEIARELDDPPKRALTEDEIPRFLAQVEALDPHIHKLVVTMMVLGTRFSEASALKLADIDWRSGVVRIRRGQVDGRVGPPKGNRARTAALPGPVLELLRGHVAEMRRLGWPGHNEWLFPTRPDVRCKRPAPLWEAGAVGKVMQRAKAAAGVHTVNATHLARHTLIGLMRGEASEAIARKVVGHASGAVHDGYGDAKVIEFAREVERVLPIGERKRGD